MDKLAAIRERLAKCAEAWWAKLAEIDGREDGRE